MTGAASRRALTSVATDTKGGAVRVERLTEPKARRITGNTSARLTLPQKQG